MYYFIVNPNSRSGRGRSIWNEIHQQLMLERLISSTALQDILDMPQRLLLMPVLLALNLSLYISLQWEVTAPFTRCSPASPILTG